MILSELKNYIKKRREVSLNDIALHFDIAPDAARGMLELWISKGKVQKKQTQSCESNCHCEVGRNNELYRWNEEIQNISIEIQR